MCFLESEPKNFLKCRVNKQSLHLLGSYDLVNMWNVICRPQCLACIASSRFFSAAGVGGGERGGSWRSNCSVSHGLWAPRPLYLVASLVCLAAAIALYIGCCCCPKQCNTCCKIKNNDDDIVTRVEKLEHFFTFYVNDRFHELQCKDLLEATKKQT